MDFDERFLKHCSLSLQNFIKKDHYFLFFEFLRMTKTDFYLMTDQLLLDKKTVKSLHKLSLYIPNLSVRQFIFVDPSFSSKRMEIENHLNIESDRKNVKSMIREIYSQLIKANHRWVVNR